MLCVLMYEWYLATSQDFCVVLVYRCLDKQKIVSDAPVSPDIVQVIQDDLLQDDIEEKSNHL